MKSLIAQNPNKDISNFEILHRKVQYFLSSNINFYFSITCNSLAWSWVWPIVKIGWSYIIDDMNIINTYDDIDSWTMIHSISWAFGENYYGIIWEKNTYIFELIPWTPRNDIMSGKVDMKDYQKDEIWKEKGHLSNFEITKSCEFSSELDPVSGILLWITNIWVSSEIFFINEWVHKNWKTIFSVMHKNWIYQFILQQEGLTVAMINNWNLQIISKVPRDDIDTMSSMIDEFLG
jgi:hypothetical protein